jgi:hypothetical protein
LVTSNLDNIIAQSRNINRGAYRVFEGEIAKRIEEDGVEALIDITLEYADDVTKRVDEIIYRVDFSDGTSMSRVFGNP